VAGSPNAASLSLTTDEPAAAPAPTDRFGAVVRAHFDFVWRSLRRLGVPSAGIDDAAQEVFCIVGRKLERINPGSERAYLFGIALRFASDVRRRQARQCETEDSELLAAIADPHTDVEALVDQKRARDLLDVVLDVLPLELRTVLMLTEGEQLTMAEVAVFLRIPQGTVASRLRRAREVFEEEVDKLLGENRVSEHDPDESLE
jgi:RNA polymerase sigma-70 factor, ECF subfamily